MVKFIATHKATGQTLEAEVAFRSAASPGQWVIALGGNTAGIRVNVTDWDVKEVKPSLHEQIRALKQGSTFHLHDPATGEGFKGLLRLYDDSIYGLSIGKKRIDDFKPARDTLELVVDHVPSDGKL